MESAMMLLLDASSAGWAALQNDHAAGHQGLTAANYVEQVLAFVNALLLQTEDAELMVWAVTDEGRCAFREPLLACVHQCNTAPLGLCDQTKGHRLWVTTAWIYAENIRASQGHRPVQSKEKDALLLLVVVPLISSASFYGLRQQHPHCWAFHWLTVYQTRQQLRISSHIKANHPIQWGRGHPCVSDVGAAIAAIENIPATAPALAKPLQTQHEQQPASATILRGLMDVVKSQASSVRSSNVGQAAWSSAVCRALCVLSKLQQGKTTSIPTGTKSRILCIKLSPDEPRQYLASVNAALCAQRCGIVIDACIVAASSSSLLQQAAHLTGGLYIDILQPSLLLQHLLTSFLVSPADRELLAKQPASKVDLRASCFCHHRPLDTGFACSVCLSVFCNRVAECSTCGTAFESHRVSAHPPAGA